MPNSLMIQYKRFQNISHYAFTLVEMMIVLVIVGILLMATLYLSNEQIQKVKDKTVKEAFLAEMQSRYSRNLGSSSFGGDNIYETMLVTFSSGDNKIEFDYNLRESEKIINNKFTDKFVIKNIIYDYSSDSNHTANKIDRIKLTYSPYQIPCKIGDDNESNNNVVIAIRVNDHKDYCFEINQKNCRLLEMSESTCESL